MQVGYGMVGRLGLQYGGKKGQNHFWLALARVIGHAYMIPGQVQFDWVFRGAWQAGADDSYAAAPKNFYFFYARKILRDRPIRYYDTGGAFGPPPLCFRVAKKHAGKNKRERMTISSRQCIQKRRRKLLFPIQPAKLEL